MDNTTEYRFIYRHPEHEGQVVLSVRAYTVTDAIKQVPVSLETGHILRDWEV